MNKSAPLAIAKDLLSFCNDHYLILYQDETDEYTSAVWDWTPFDFILRRN